MWRGALDIVGGLANDDDGLAGGKARLLAHAVVMLEHRLTGALRRLEGDPIDAVGDALPVWRAILIGQHGEPRRIRRYRSAHELDVHGILIARHLGCIREHDPALKRGLKMGHRRTRIGVGILPSACDQDDHEQDHRQPDRSI